jgi:hypothetical protein
VTTHRTTAADRARGPVRRGTPRRWAVLVGTGLVGVAVAVAGGVVAVGGGAEAGVSMQVPRAAPVPAVTTAEPVPDDAPRAGRTDVRDDDRVADREDPVPVRAATLPPVVAASPPVRVVVGGLVDVRVRPVGVDPDGSMELPSSGDVAGWYRFGAAPGDPEGTVVIASHVDTSDGVGEFAALGSAEAGQAVTVRGADGERHRYRVTDVRRYDKSDVPLDELFDRTGDPRLVLVTCGGRWDARAGSYEDNLVVRAVPDAAGRADR